MDQISSNLPYLVVLESTLVTGGHAFMRKLVEYKDETEFQTSYQANDKEKVIASGIDQLEVHKLLCEVPVICHLLAAVEKIFEGRENQAPLDAEVDHHLTNAKYDIFHVEEMRQREKYSFKFPEGFVHHLDALTTTSPNKNIYKTLYFMGVIAYYRAQTDTINFEKMFYNLAQLSLTPQL